MGFKYKEQHVVASPELNNDSCEGCIYETFNTSGNCLFNRHIEDEYDFSCSDNNCIFIPNIVYNTLKKL